MNSCIYEGQIRHRRFLPVKNIFRYSIFLIYLDLSEINLVFKGRWLWSIEKPNVAWFRRKDHFGDPDINLDFAVRELVERRLGKRLEGRICLLTHLRYFGYCFNPVCFYFCYDSVGAHISSIVAEVSNTPWNECYLYVLGEDMNQGSVEYKRFLFNKDFHVSPFMDMDFQYDWRFREPGDLLNIHFRNLKKDKLFFDATLRMKRKEINGNSLAKLLTCYPPMTVKVIAMIYFQALRLRIKGAPFYTHPNKLQLKPGSSV